LAGITPSSPNIYLFKDGELIFILHRYEIERSAAGNLAEALMNKFNEVCSKENDDTSAESLRKFFVEHYDFDPLKESEN
jgi:hypothetical protein